MGEAPAGVAGGDVVGVAALFEAVGGEVVYGFEEPESPSERARLDGEHRLIHEVSEEVVYLDGVEGFLSGDCLGCGQVEGVGKGRESLEQVLLRCGE